MDEIDLILRIVQAAASVLGALGVVFTYRLVSNALEKRRDDSAFNITDAVLATDLRKAFHHVLCGNPENTPEWKDSAEVIEYACEMWGVMVFEGTISLCVLDRMAGGFIRLSWEKLQDFVREERKCRPTYAEWFQWLYDRLNEHVPREKRMTQLAYIKYCDALLGKRGRTGNVRCQANRHCR
jgi:hypothetical protein